MAVVSTPMNSAFLVYYQTGLTETGAPIIRSKTLNNVKADATEQAVYNVASALFGLSTYQVIDVVLRRNYHLTDEE